MASGHEGVFARGMYRKKAKFEYANPGKPQPQFLTRTGKRRITELCTVSPFAMVVNKDVGTPIAKYLGDEVVRATKGMLEKEIEKLTKKL